MSPWILWMTLISQAPEESLDGVYTMPIEVSCYGTEVLELREGRFRYWDLSSCVPGSSLIEYPLHGTYEVRDNLLVLWAERDRHQDGVSSNSIHHNSRILHHMNGHLVLVKAFPIGDEVPDPFAEYRPLEEIVQPTNDVLLKPFDLLIQTRATQVDELKDLRFPSMKKLGAERVYQGCLNVEGTYGSRGLVPED